MKVDGDVLLLSYLDKICLTLTGDLRRALLHHVENTPPKPPPIDWGVGEGGRYACGLAWLIFTTAIVF